MMRRREISTFLLLGGMVSLAGWETVALGQNKPAAKAEPAAKAPAAPAKAPAPAKAEPEAPKPESSEAEGQTQTPTVKVTRGAGGEKVYRITEGIVIEGKIQKPEAFYVLQRSNINYDWEGLKKSFIPKVLESVKRSPF